MGPLPREPSMRAQDVQAGPSQPRPDFQAAGEFDTSERIYIYIYMHIYLCVYPDIYRIYTCPNLCVYMNIHISTCMYRCTSRFTCGYGCRDRCRYVDVDEGVEKCR